MTTKSPTLPNQQPPLTITIDDIVQARDEPTRMRWPVDPETTERLRRVVEWQVNTDDTPNWQRRLLRWLTRTQ